VSELGQVVAAGPANRECEYLPRYAAY
jgi:hypothetical protein